MKNHSILKYIIKNKLFILGTFCMTGLILFQQTEHAWSMDTPEKAKTNKPVKKEKTIKVKPAKTLSLRDSREMTLTTRDPLRDFHKLSIDYEKDYQQAQNKVELTQNFISATLEIFSTIPKDTKKKPFLSLYKVFLEQIEKRNIIEKFDFQKLSQLLITLKDKSYDTSESLTVYEPKSKKGSTAITVPKLSLPYEPIELTKEEILAGANSTPLYLIERTATNQISNVPKKCFQFTDIKFNPFIYKGKPSPCYDTPTFDTHLNLTGEVYNSAIKVILEKAYRALKTTLNNPNIDETVIKTLLDNYMDPTNKDRFIDATGSSVKEHEWKEIKDYMKLCSAVYTDFYTRDFLTKQNLPEVNKKLDQIIQKYEKITQQLNNLEIIKKEYENIFTRGATRLEKGTHAKSGQVVSEKEVITLDTTPLVENLKKQYEEYIKVLNNYLSHIGQPPVNNPDITEIDDVHQKLSSIKNIVEAEYYWYFEREDKDPEAWSLELGKKPAQFSRFLFGGKDVQHIPTYKGRQLTAKAVAASSFLHKAGLLDEKNITILDIGFRNAESYGSTWNDIVSTLMRFKTNPKSWFDAWGEVDYIAFIERDPENKKDKFVIVYAGSNSQWDWGIDFTTGSTQIFGISVHAGIGWLFNQTIQTYHNVLFQRVKEYYKNIPDERKPRELEIITSGHSLGAGLAELAAFYYKSEMLEKFESNLKIPTRDVKSYTFAAPAIIGASSKATFEHKLGKDNVYRVWVTNDPVAVLSETIKIQGGQHVGKSIPLYNIMGLEKDTFDWWGPHGATYYEAFITAAEKPQYSEAYSNLIFLLNNYIQTTHLDVYKINRIALNTIPDYLSHHIQQYPMKIYQGLAEHIIKYSPTAVKLKPYQTVDDIQPHSPRYAAALSPRFEVEEDAVERTSNSFKDRYQITAKFKLSMSGNKREIDFPIVASTKCATTDIQEFLTQQNLSIKIDAKTAEKFSCGACLAKRVFVSQYTTYPSAYKGGATGLIYSHHQDTLTKMFTKCVEEKACSVDYLKQTGFKKHPLEQAEMILKEVGLDSEFRAKKVQFSRFQSQDDYEGPYKIRPGIDLTEGYKESETKIEGSLLKDLIDMDSGTFQKSHQFTIEEATNPNHICYRIITAIDKPTFWNDLTSLINEEELTQIFSDYYGTGQPDQNGMEKKFDNFIGNLLSYLKAFYRMNRDNTRILSPVRIAKMENNIKVKLKKNLDRLKQQVIENASWKISDHKTLQIESEHKSSESDGDELRLIQ